MKKFLILFLMSMLFAASVRAATTLPIEKSVGGLTEISVGDTVTFHLAVTATGGAVNNASIWDTVPDYMTFISAAPTAVVTGGVWSWSDSFMNQNDSINISIIATLDFYPGTPFVNTATTDSDDSVQAVSTVSLDVITSPTVTETNTPTFTPTDTETVTETNTPTSTPTDTETVTETVTETPTPTVTDTVTETGTETSTKTVTQTITPNQTQTALVLTQTQVAINKTATAAAYQTRTWTPTVTKTATKTSTPTATRTASRTITPTFTITKTRTASPTVSPTPTATMQRTSGGANYNIFDTRLRASDAPDIITVGKCRLISITIDSTACDVEGATLTVYDGNALDDIVASKLKRTFPMLNCADAPKTVKYGFLGLGVYMSEGLVVSKTAATIDAVIKYEDLTQ